MWKKLLYSVISTVISKTSPFQLIHCNSRFYFYILLGCFLEYVFTFVVFILYVIIFDGSYGDLCRICFILFKFFTHSIHSVICAWCLLLGYSFFGLFLWFFLTWARSPLITSKFCLSRLCLFFRSPKIFSFLFECEFAQAQKILWRDDHCNHYVNDEVLRNRCFHFFFAIKFWEMVWRLVCFNFAFVGIMYYVPLVFSRSGLSSNETPLFLLIIAIYLFFGSFIFSLRTFHLLWRFKKKIEMLPSKRLTMDHWLFFKEFISFSVKAILIPISMAFFGFFRRWVVHYGPGLLVVSIGKYPVLSFDLETLCYMLILIVTGLLCFLYCLAFFKELESEINVNEKDLAIAEMALFQMFQVIFPLPSFVVWGSVKTTLFFLILLVCRVSIYHVIGY